VGPLLGGVLSTALGWQSIFFINAGTVLLVPLAARILPGAELRSAGSLDFWDGAALGMVIVGALLAPSAGAQSGWLSPTVLVGAAIFGLGLLALLYRQRKAASPFIPREFLRSRQYVSLLGVSFTVMAANLAVLIGIPILIAAFHGLTAIQVGLVMLPGAICSSVFGVLAGRLTDRRGGALPMRAGAPVMLLAVLGLSTSAGVSVWAVALFAGLLGAGFGLVNTPLAATISKIMRGPMLASALSINPMLFFLGGSFGATLLIAVTAARGTTGSNPLNPFYSGAATGFSDGFLILALPVIAALALLLAFANVAEPSVAGAEMDAEPGDAESPGWTADCSVPWAPRCVEHLEAVPAPAG
jgi:MFS family permease